ncbi:MAG: TaqI-like C-terminal specificity domain-containing protein, partial [candidate division WOR-3 bacterium]
NIVDVSESFEEVLLEQVIIIFKNEKSDNRYTFTSGEGWEKEIKRIGIISATRAEELNLLPIYIDNFKMQIFIKLKADSVLLKDISETFRGLPLQKKCSSEGGTPLLRGDNIGKYLIYGEVPKAHLSKNDYSNNKITKLIQPKIISQNIIAHVKTPFDRIIIMATYDKKGFLTLDTVMNTLITDSNYCYEYILAILNSKLAEWFYYWFVYNRAVRTMHFDEYYIGKLPIKMIDRSSQEPFVYLVSQILSITQSDDYLSNPRKQVKVKELEKEIDQLVYKLYGLTDEEIKIVEGA